MPERDSLLGTQIDEYRLEALLGHGGMARVYRGIDTHLQRYTAIKVIHTHFRSESEYVQRFGTEAQAIAQLDHAHVVSIYRYGNVGGLLYMAMQYIEGTDLRSVLDGFQRDSEFMHADDVLRIIRDAGRGLDYIHKRGIIHRDVKPSNIMLTKRGKAIITDFGLALIVDTGTHGEIFGTPHYMSPEQAVSSARVIPQSDIYSMGVILYEMLTNRVPFNEGQALNIAMAHLANDPPPPRSIRPELSAAVEDVILTALAKEAHERYQSGSKLVAALRDAIKKSKRMMRKTTIPNRSIVQRVRHDMESNPLPPIPAVTPADRNERGQRDSSVSAQVAQQLGRSDTVNAAPRRTTSKLKRLISFTFYTSILGFIATLALSALPLFADVRMPTLDDWRSLISIPANAPQNAATAELIYNNNGFYIRNVSNQSIRVSRIAFQAVNGRGNLMSYRYEGVFWSPTYAFIERNSRCNAIEIVNRLPKRPDGCERTSIGQPFNSLITSSPTDERMFWTGRAVADGAVAFVVFWDGAEIARCTIAAGFCGVPVGN